ncbi:MAG: hypothetical protein ACFCU5_07440 [Pleurocapsa sp.]
MKNTQSNTNKNFKPQTDYGYSLVPNFWLYLGIIAILSCLSFYGYRYWQLSRLTPQANTQPNVKPSNSSSQIDSLDSQQITREELSAEELSIAADLDNIDLILQEMEQNANQKIFLPVKSIPEEKQNDLAVTKLTNKIQSASNVKSLQTNINQTDAIPSLERGINQSSIQKIIEPSTEVTQNRLNSREKKQDFDQKNLINSYEYHAEKSHEDPSSLGKIYKQNSENNNSELTAIDAKTNNTNVVNSPQTWRSPSGLESQISSVTEPGFSSAAVNNGQLPTNLSDYQIKPQDYNLLVPSNYLALPRTNSQLTQIPNNGSSTRETSTVPINNLNSYQLQLQELNQFNLNTGLNTANPEGASLPNSSRLQPTGVWQPSGLF